MKKGGIFLSDPVLENVFTRERFSEDQQEIYRMAKEFACERILPLKQELMIHNQDLTMGLMREVGELGMTAIDIPEKYDGLELDKTTSALVVEALTFSGSSSWVVTFSAHVGIGTLPIVYFGDDAQKAKYLPKLGSAEFLSAYALTEPDAGSDAMNLKTTAEPTDDGDAIVINGTKQYITNGSWADVFIVFAQLQGAGPTAFIIERDSEGLSTGAEEKKMGIEGSSTVTLILDNVRVPRENLLGKPGQGMDIALNILNVGRLKLGAADLGGCKNTIDEAVKYALDRHQFGQPIAYFQAIRKKFAEMVVSTYMLDSVVYRTVGMMDERIVALDPTAEDHYSQVTAALEEYAIETSIAKILGSETLFHVADHGVQILGGYGFSEDYPMAAVFRSTRIDRIFEGTNEINRMVIYGYFLKKALMEELPLRDAEKTWSDDTEADAAASGSLKWEIAALDVARRLVVKFLFEAISKYGQDLRNEQVVGEDLADLIINYYAASSAICRISQLDEKARNDRAVLAVGRLASATAFGELSRLYHRLRPVLFGDGYADKFTAAIETQLHRLHLPFDPVKEIHILTDDLFSHGRYRF
jgi:alkylation response protein AidB-like acyl-CoA dehydrogenase